VDGSFSYACSAGVVGGASPTEQSGPGCSRPCPAGRVCPGKTTSPELCPRGAYCPFGSVFPFECPRGRFSQSTSLESEAGCMVCPIGSWCGVGSASPKLCVEGRFGAMPAQTSRECTGPCIEGFYCERGSTSNRHVHATPSLHPVWSLSLRLRLPLAGPPHALEGDSMVISVERG
jgi:hypothetical protein